MIRSRISEIVVSADVRLAHPRHQLAAASGGCPPRGSECGANASSPELRRGLSLPRESEIGSERRMPGSPPAATSSAARPRSRAASSASASDVAAARPATRGRGIRGAEPVEDRLCFCEVPARRGGVLKPVGGKPKVEQCDRDSLLGLASAVIGKDFLPEARRPRRSRPIRTQRSRGSFRDIERRIPARAVGHRALACRCARETKSPSSLASRPRHRLARSAAIRRCPQTPAALGAKLERRRRHPDSTRFRPRPHSPERRARAAGPRSRDRVLETPAALGELPRSHQNRHRAAASRSSSSGSSAAAA